MRAIDLSLIVILLVKIIVASNGAAFTPNKHKEKSVGRRSSRDFLQYCWRAV